MQTPCRACIWIWHLAGHVHAHTWYTCPCSVSKRNIIFPNLPRYISWFSLPGKQVAHKIIRLVLAFHLLTYSFNIWSCMHVICIRTWHQASQYIHIHVYDSVLASFIVDMHLDAMFILGFLQSSLCTYKPTLNLAGFPFLHARTPWRFR